MSRQKLVEKWRRAQDVQLSTALDLNLSDTTVYRLGRLVITSVRLHDVGLVGGKETVSAVPEASSDTEASSILAELVSFGLPTSFGKKGGSLQNRREGRKGAVTSANNIRLASRGQPQPRSLQGTGDDTTDGTNGGRDTPWLQGFDEKWGCHYYYNTHTQESVWEPPAEGFVPWDASGSSSAPDETHKQKQRASTALNVADVLQQQAPDGVKATADGAAIARVNGGIPAAAGGGAADIGALPRAPPRMLTEEDVLRAMGLLQDSSGDGGGTEGLGAQRHALATAASTPAVPVSVPSGKGAAELRGGEGAVGSDGCSAGDALLRNLLLRSPALQPLISSQPQQQRAVPPTALSEEQLLARLSVGAAPMPPPPPAPAPPPPSPPPPPLQLTAAMAAAPSSLLRPDGHMAGPKPPTLRMLTEDDILRSMGLRPSGPACTEDNGSGSNGAKELPPPPQAPVVVAAGPPPPSNFWPVQDPQAAQGPEEESVGQSPGESCRQVLPPPSPQQPSVPHSGAPYPPRLQAPELQPPGPYHPKVLHTSGAAPAGPRPAPPPGFHPPVPHPQGPAIHDHQRHHQGTSFHRGHDYPPTPPLPPPGFGPPPPLFPQQPPVDLWPPPGAPPFGAPPGPPVPMLPPPPPGFAPGHSMPLPYGMPPYPYHGHTYPPYSLPPLYGMPPPEFSHPGGPGLPQPPFYGPDGYLPGAPCPAVAPHPHHYPHLHNHQHHNHEHHGRYQPPPLPVSSPPPTPAGSDPAAASLFGPQQPAAGGAVVGYDACSGPEPNRRAVTWTLEELEHQLNIMAAAVAEEREGERGGAGPAAGGPLAAVAGSCPRDQEVCRVGNSPGFSDARQRPQKGKDSAPPQQQRRREGGHQTGGGSSKSGWASAEGPSSSAADAEEGEDDAAFYDSFAARGGVAAAQHLQRLAPVVKPAVGDDDGTRRVMLDPTTAAYVRTLLPRSAAKYWMQRYSLFSRFDSLVQLDTEGWWSVTPEVLASHQADRMREMCRWPLVAMDACCGCGGNVIQMATVFPAVIGVEISPRRVEMARNNAAVYEVGHKCHFLCADFFEVAPGLKVDALFMSPPWGGPKYQHVNTFDVFFPLVGFNKSLLALLDVTMECVRGQDGVVAAFLPRNTDLTQLAAVVPEHVVWEVERAYVNNKLKGITLYCHPGAAPGQPNVRLAAEAEFAAPRPEPAAAG